MLIGITTSIVLYDDFIIVCKRSVQIVIIFISFEKRNRFYFITN